MVFFADGAYAQYAAVNEDSVIAVPEAIDLKDAAAVHIQGLTAHYLTNSTYPVQRDDWVLVHAGAGGTGGLMIEMAKLRGGRSR